MQMTNSECIQLFYVLRLHKIPFSRLYYENLIPISPTDDHMELREGSNEDEDFEDCVDEVNEFEASNIKDQIVPEDSSVIPEYDDKQEIVAEYVDPSSDDGKSFNQ